ncbi:MAG: hypothetical protein MR881_07140, partial [Bacteroidales bacterium]|nr:hypothetical protein [Bacteroidales bacterium]
YSSRQFGAFACSAAPLQNPLFSQPLNLLTVIAQFHISEQRYREDHHRALPRKLFLSYKVFLPFL